MFEQTRQRLNAMARRIDAILHHMSHAEGPVTVAHAVHGLKVRHRHVLDRFDQVRAAEGEDSSRLLDEPGLMEEIAALETDTQYWAERLEVNHNPDDETA